MTGKESAAGGSATLNETQLKFLASMMKNAKTKPDVDWDKVAAECGGMTSKSAKERYRLLAIKLGWSAKNGGDGESSAVPKTPKKPAGVAKRTGRVGDSGKKGKGKGKKAAVQSDEESTADVVQGESEVDELGEA